MNRIRLYFDDQQLEEEVLNYTGEWMEIGSSHSRMMRVGDLINCEYMEQRHYTRVAGITLDRIYLFTTTTRKLDLIERRSDQRIPISISAKLLDVRESIPIQLTDINLGGFGFIAEQSRIGSYGRYLLCIDSEELSIEAQIQMMYRSEKVKDIHYGAEIVFMKREHLDRLRMYLLFMQYAASR
jgi:hypothetical protein